MSHLTASQIALAPQFAGILNESVEWTIENVVDNGFSGFLAETDEYDFTLEELEAIVTKADADSADTQAFIDSIVL
ncbi:hypothetical protein [Chroococcidiopsis sp.]|uniref:hypothetical protein n=1 Tax=Chroococcidiopsis sp. TaxID=3088168 RepID=UPI003F39F857